MSAHHIARSFEDEEAQWLLTTMCLFFRRRNLDSMETIIAHLRQDVVFGTVMSSSAQGLALPRRSYRLSRFAQDVRDRKDVRFLTEMWTLIQVRPN